MKYISIIVPVYNVEKYLRCCIDSILSQSYRFFELILVDDGSTDSSGQICDEYEAKYSQIRVFHQNNTGVSSARNFGISVSKFDIVMFVDSDDCINSELLSTLVLHQVKYDTDIVYCGYKKIYQGREHVVPPIVLPGLYDFRAIREVVIPSFLGFSSSIENINPEMGSSCRMLIRRDKICNFININTNEDFLFVINSLLKANKVYVLSDCLYYYLINIHSLTHRFVMNKSGECEQMYEILKSMFDKYNYSLGKVLLDRYMVNTISFVVNNEIISNNSFNDSVCVIAKYLVFMRANISNLDKYIPLQYNNKGFLFIYLFYRRSRFRAVKLFRFIRNIKYIQCIYY